MLNFLFAWRYFRAKKSTNAINIIAWISIVAILFGTTALILVLSVFNGFEGMVKSLYSNFYPDLKVMPATGKTIHIPEGKLQQLKNITGIKGVSCTAEEKALVQNGDYQSLVFLKGVDENYRSVSGVSRHLINGNYDLGNDSVPKMIVGAGVEDALGIQADRNIFPLHIYLPRKSSTEQLNMLEDISSDTIRSSAAFLIQQDFDNKYAITNIGFVKRSLKLSPDEYSAAEIALNDPSAAATVQRKVKKIFDAGFIVLDKYEQNRNLFRIMKLERWFIYGIFCLIIFVAAFNMIGALTMLVLEKQKDISVLNALGADRNFIQGIFLKEGILLAFIGAGIGILLALLIVTLQLKYHIVPLEGGSFLINYYPVQLKWTDLALVAATVFFVSVIASWVPSRKAAMQQFSLRTD